jgi:16S rRNA U1498 N3-methylase RsmE
MRLHRFYVTQPLGEEIVVDDVSTIKQWSRVFRYKQGDFVTLFDGHYKDCTYEIASMDQKEARLTLVSIKELTPQSRSLTLQTL